MSATKKKSKGKEKKMKKKKRIKKLGAKDFLWRVNIDGDDVDHEDRN